MPALAIQRVTLHNGSDVVCDHLRPVNGQMRLFLTPDEGSYLDVAPADIVRQEVVPDAVSPTHATTAAATTATATTTRPMNVPTLLAQAATVHHIDVDLLASVVHAESNGNPQAVSRAGAQGLMQLMPGTAAVLGVQNSFAAAQNIAGGTAYLDTLLTRYHDNLALALAAYNAGPEAVDRYHGIPPYAETRRYVAHVIHEFNRRKLQMAREQARHQMAAFVVPSHG
ncbi:MAG TPA: lytic transglycosylase domain-containing protein [Acidobacteriaceae bacterium]|nr:lytic transglycosylase domain-containing protein [Acidobacteriaceae bacterium]